MTSTEDSERLIEGLIKSQLTELRSIHGDQTEARQTSAKPVPIVITISRGFGTLGGEIAHLLADSLNVSCSDSSILQDVAQRADVDESLVKALDEHVSIVNGHYGDGAGQWWKRLIDRYSFTHLDYQEHLAKTVLSIALHGGVIVGRGANFILGPEGAFRVRLVGSRDKCSARVAAREGISIERAAEKVCDIDCERSLYIQKLYDADIDQPLFYDLIINTDRFDQIQTAELILEALQKSGYKLTAGAFDRVTERASP